MSPDTNHLEDSRRMVITEDGPFTVHVLATTCEGTKCALGTARRLIQGLDARVVLLVAYLTSSLAPYDPISSHREDLIDAYRSLAASIGIHVLVRFCVCRRYEDVVREMVGRSALVIVGGRRRMWWPSREERLVSRLFAQGYPVVFAQVGADRLVASVPIAS